MGKNIFIFRKAKKKKTRHIEADWPTVVRRLKPLVSLTEFRLCADPLHLFPAIVLPATVVRWCLSNQPQSAFDILQCHFLCNFCHSTTKRCPSKNNTATTIPYAIDSFAPCLSLPTTISNCCCKTVFLRCRWQTAGQGGAPASTI